MGDVEFLNIELIEWIGYLASALVLVSLSLSSMLRLRIVNLLGSVVFVFYGFSIGSYPVGLMNLAIVFFNIHYLRKLVFTQEQFDIVETEFNEELVQKFIERHKSDIHGFFPHFSTKQSPNTVVLMILRDMSLAGLFVALKEGNRLNVELDYVSAPFRDYKNGKFIIVHLRKTLKDKGYDIVETRANTPQQIKYLEKVGFTEVEKAGPNAVYQLQL